MNSVNIAFDNMAQELLRLYKLAHPEVKDIDAGRYVIGVMSGLGHVVDSLIVESGQKKDPPSAPAKGYVFNTEGRLHETDLIWHSCHRCWVVVPGAAIGQPRQGLLGVCSTLKQLTNEKVTEQFEGKFVYQGGTEGTIFVFHSDKQIMHANFEKDRLTTSIKDKDECTK